MVVSVLPLKDATLYEYYTNRNTGIDQILELGYDYDYSCANRIVMKFDLSEIQTLVAGKSQPQYILKLYTCDNEEIPEDLTVKVFPLSETFDMGIGKFYDHPENTNGVSWTSNGDAPWTYVSGSPAFHQEFTYASGGGTWNTNYSASYEASYESQDMSIDVTTIVDSWVSGSLGHFGLIIKIDDEYNLDQDTTLKHFSKETHTVYEPRLFINYTANEFVTGSFNPLTDEDSTLAIKNLRNHYYTTDLARFYVHARDRYVARTYSKTNPYTISKYLPENTYYSVVDGASKTTIIPFSDYTKVNMDATDGNYFDIDMSNFYPDRHYKILFKIDWTATRTQIYDNGLYFKVKSL